MGYSVYRVRNLINGKFYIGVHKTDNPNDAYLGSGSIIRQAVVKYGRANFCKDILEVFDAPEPAFRLEERLVASEIGLPGCYNLRKGGEGGFDYINRNGLVDRIAAGRILGCKMRDSGGLALIRTHQHQVDAGRLGGQKSTPAKLISNAQNIKSALHKRWHVNRAIVTPECAFCTGGVSV